MSNLECLGLSREDAAKRDDGIAENFRSLLRQIVTCSRHNTSLKKPEEVRRVTVPYLGRILNAIIGPLQDNAGGRDVGLRGQLPFDLVQRRVARHDAIPVSI